MAGRASAFATLGLAPGADAAAVERAYKRLIKLHHPDREGGDSGRAAEINRAYRELRGVPPPGDPLEFNEDLALDGSGLRWPHVALALGAASAVLLILHGPIAPLTRNLLPAAAPNFVLGHFPPTAMAGDTMDQPLDEAAIDGAVRDALELKRTSDEIALASASSDCRRQFRQEPTIAGLDRCVAFDDAVVMLQDRDPLHDRGPFAQLAVTGRQWSAGSALSDDYLAIDGRFDRIRLRVELALAAEFETPPLPPVPPNFLAVGGSDR